MPYTPLFVWLLTSITLTVACVRAKLVPLGKTAESYSTLCCDDLDACGSMTHCYWLSQTAAESSESHHLH